MIKVEFEIPEVTWDAFKRICAKNNAKPENVVHNLVSDIVKTEALRSPNEPPTQKDA